MLPPAAHPTLDPRKSRSRMGQGPSRVRPDQFVPPSVVRCTQPSTFGEISPPPTQPYRWFTKSTAPSNTESTEGPQLQVAPPSGLTHSVIPDRYAVRSGRNVKSAPNQPP